MLVLAIVVAAGLGYFAGVHVPKVRSQAIQSWEGRLSAVADDRKAAIEAWLEERLNDARVSASFPSAASLLEGRQPTRATPGQEGPEHLLRELEVMVQASGSTGAYLLNRKGEVVAATSGSLPLDPTCAAQALEATPGLAARLIDLAPDQAGRLRLAFVAPVVAEAGAEARPIARGQPPIGAAVFALAPESRLFPLLRREPVPTKTQEAILVERRGNRLVFLSPLRHRSDPPLTYSVSIDRAAPFAATAAVSGVSAIRQYVDYRGVRVLAATRKIDGTPWGLVVKVDLSEALAASRDEVRDTALVALGGLIALLGAGYGLWRSRQAAFETAALRTETRLGVLFKHANDIVIFTDLEGRLVDGNEAAVQAYGYTREELLALRLGDLRVPEARAGLAGDLERLRSSQGIRFETRHVRKDGTSFPVEVVANIVRRGPEASIVGVIRDITERQQAAARIQFLNRLLRTISEINQLVVREHLPERLLDGVCRAIVEHGELRMAWVGMADVETGLVRPVAWAGFSEEYLKGITVRFDDTPLGRGPTGTAIREGRPVICNDWEQDDSMAPWRDQARAQGYRASAAFPLGSGGQVSGALNVYATEPDVFVDETVALLVELAADLGFALEAARVRGAHHLAERALQESEARYRVTAEMTGKLLYDYDVPSGGITWQGAITRLTGFTAQEFQAVDIKQWEEMIHPDDQEMALRLLEEAAGSDGRYDVRYRFRRKDGSYIWVTDEGVYLRNAAGEPVRMLGTMGDITQEVTLEAQLRQAQKMEAVGNLAGGVAHDFNNLLQAILSVVEVLRTQRDDDRRVAERLQELEENVRRGAQLTRQLLLFSRREATKRETLDLNEALQGATAMLRRLLRENIAITLSLAQGELLVEADRGQLEQIVTNLALNSADAMPAGGTLSITTGKLGNEVWFDVEDTGFGVPEEIRERIFEPFFTTKDTGQGTGLGLAVVHGIVTGHGGRIEVTSQVGRGCRVHISLPVAQRARRGVVHLPAEYPGLPAEGWGERILVVEDEAGARQALCDILALLGYRATAVGSGEAALALPVEPAFDLLLTDVMLPGSPGPEVAKALRERWAGLKVILMSGYAQDEAVRRVVLTGYVRFLQKPFDMATLAREVRRALEE